MQRKAEHVRTPDETKFMKMLRRGRVDKKRRHRRRAWGTFWMAGEHFGPKFTLFCHIVKFVGKYPLLTLFLRVKIGTLTPKNAVLTH